MKRSKFIKTILAAPLGIAAAPLALKDDDFGKSVSAPIEPRVDGGAFFGDIRFIHFEGRIKMVDGVYDVPCFRFPTNFDADSQDLSSPSYSRMRETISYWKGAGAEFKIYISGEEYGSPFKINIEDETLQLILMAKGKRGLLDGRNCKPS
tara:strand:+ start:35127 stop:35576 length:450 start_codon:yes stop_codon:yes gene_type:complete